MRCGGTLIIINKKTILTSIAAISLIALVIPWICFVTQAQTDTTFKPTDKFDIPAYNSTISFATGGTYEQASLENNAWKFVNLRLNNTRLMTNLTVSVQDSNVKITTYQRFNASTTAARLRYTVVGHGTQTFNFGFTLRQGGWSVSFNGRLTGENEGYSVSPDQTITVTGATVNASISYLNLNAFGGTTEDSNLPFYLNHRVAIATGIIVAVAVALTVMIRRRNHEGKQV
jgi:hypothetical protein